MGLGDMLVSMVVGWRGFIGGRGWAIGRRASPMDIVVSKEREDEEDDKEKKVAIRRRSHVGYVGYWVKPRCLFI